jgi:predicted acylesterase/phospholipase RssA
MTPDRIPLRPGALKGGFMIRTRDQHLFDAGPKRILSLDGGGVRGLVTLGLLERAEAILKLRSSNPEAFRLSHYFDLIGGTSTGGIIATLLALGHRVEDIRTIYLGLCPRVFRRPGILGWLTNPMGLFKSVFRTSDFARQINKVIDDYVERAGRTGHELTLNSDLLQTGLAIVTKRIDRGSVWVLTNNPRSMFWDPESPHWPAEPVNQKDWFANRDFPLRSLVRATASAPFFLDAIEIGIGDKQRGLFLDGGASPYNNPAKELFLMSTLKRFKDDGAKSYSPFGFDWDAGKDNLFLYSIGTGIWRSTVEPAAYAKKLNLKKATYTLASIIDDGMKSSVVWLQALSEPARPFEVDVQLGDMRQMRIMQEPLLTFRHVNARLEKAWLNDHLGLDFRDRVVMELRDFDNASPKNLARLCDIGSAAAEKFVSEEDFPPQFDVGARA